MMAIKLNIIIFIIVEGMLIIYVKEKEYFAIWPLHEQHNCDQQWPADMDLKH